MCFLCHQLLLLGGERILRIFWLGLGLLVGGRRRTITGEVRVVRSPDVKFVKPCLIAILLSLALKVKNIRSTIRLTVTRPMLCT